MAADPEFVATCNRLLGESNRLLEFMYEEFPPEPIDLVVSRQILERSRELAVQFLLAPKSEERH